MKRRRPQNFSGTELNTQSTALLSPELQAKLGIQSGTYGTTEDAIVLLPSRKKQGARSEKRAAVVGRVPKQPLTRAERRAQKSKDRKFANMEENRGRKARRIELYDSLQRSELKPEEQALLFHSGMLGHKLSAKELNAQRVRESQAGLGEAFSDTQSQSDNSDSDSSTGSLLIEHDLDEDDVPVDNSQPLPAIGQTNVSSDLSVGGRHTLGPAKTNMKAVRFADPEGPHHSQADSTKYLPRSGNEDASSSGSDDEVSEDDGAAAWRNLDKFGNTIFSPSSDGDGHSEELSDSSSESSDNERRTDGARVNGRSRADDHVVVTGNLAGNGTGAALPSRFSFTVRLPGTSSQPSHGNDEEHASAVKPIMPHNGPPSTQDVLSSAPALVPAALPSHAAIHSSDAAVQRLMALRKKNLEKAASTAAPGNDAVASAANTAPDSTAPSSTWDTATAADIADRAEATEEADAEDDNVNDHAVNADEVSSKQHCDRAILPAHIVERELIARTAGFTSAAEVLLARETYSRDADADPDDQNAEKDGASHFLRRRSRGHKADSTEARVVSASRTAAATAVNSDPYLATAAMWSADGNTLLPNGGRPPSSTAPASCYSAYAPLPTGVRRYHSVVESRSELPVVRSEAEVMDALADNDVIVIAGETGSGKTTQVPQFLWEAGYGTPYAVLQPIPTAAAREKQQRPNALFRGFPGMIGVTQPRRVAAIAMAHRVATELGHPLGGGASDTLPANKESAANTPTSPASPVGYQVRFDSSTVGPATRLKFMTDGILLREAAADLLLRSYSVIVLDEAHERSVNGDVLIGLLSRALPLRNTLAREQAEAAAAAVASGGPFPDPRTILAPLKLIIMSATLRVTDFTENATLFPLRPPPLVKIDARQFPVTIHFSRRTELDNYLEAAFKKVCAIHTRLPEGGILVFVTGAAEVEELVKRLRERFDVKKREQRRRAQANKVAAVAAASAAFVNVTGVLGTDATELPRPVDGRVALSSSNRRKLSDTAVAVPIPSGKLDTATLEPTPQVRETDDDDGPEKDDEGSGWGPIRALPLYAMLSPTAQQRVFAPTPEGTRLIVVATNVAETSLTIPGIRYVVDTGRVKRRVFDLRSGSSSFTVGWISRASADQRAGRAGRTGPGHTYRLYSSALFSNDAAFPAFEAPETTSIPAPSLVLSLKALGIGSVASFPFPSPPAPTALASAIRYLARLGALVPVMRWQQDALLGAPTAAQSQTPTPLSTEVEAAASDAASKLLASVESETLTPLGLACAQLPLSPSLAKVLVLAEAACANEGSSSTHHNSSSNRSDSSNASLLDYAIALVAALSIPEPFVRPHQAPKPPTAKRAGGETEGGDDSEADELSRTDSTVTEKALLTRMLLEQEIEESNSTSSDAATSGVAAATRSPRHDENDEKAAAARNAAAAAHATFRHPLSDGLTMLRACGAYAHVLATGGSGAAAAFAKSHWLRAKAMQEWVAMRKQLHSAVYSARDGNGSAAAGSTVDAPALLTTRDEDGEAEVGITPAPEARNRVPTFVLALPPPSPETDVTLRQLLAAGQLEHVARRASPDDAARLLAAAGLPPSGRTKSGVCWVPYVPASDTLAPPLFLHPGSAVSPGRSAGPEVLPAWVTFAEIVISNVNAASSPGDDIQGAPTAAPLPPRSYMRCVTAIEPTWIATLAADSPLLRFDPPLDTPAPSYDPTRDALVCHAVPVFGDRAWRLPATLQLMPATVRSSSGRGYDALLDPRLRVFGRALLEGNVAPALGAWADSLASPPSSITKGYSAAGQKRVSALLQALAYPPTTDGKSQTLRSGVDSAAALAAVWRRFPAYLQAEYLAWLPEKWHASVNKTWPAVVAASLQHWTTKLASPK